MIYRLFRRGRGEFQSLLTDAASGRLDGAARQRLDTLAAADPALQAQRDEMLALTALLRSQPMALAPRSFALSSADAEAPRARRPTAWLRPLQAMTATAALVLVALIATDLAVVDPAQRAGTAEIANLTSEAAPEPGAAAGGRAADIEALGAEDGIGNADASAPDQDLTSSPAMAPAQSPAPAPADGSPPAADDGTASTAAPAPGEAGTALPFPAPEAAATAPEGRGALRWATAIVGLLTATLALIATALAWRARRSS